jgi:hypothetical protein
VPTLPVGVGGGRYDEVEFSSMAAGKRRAGAGDAAAAAEAAAAAAATEPEGKVVPPPSSREQVASPAVGDDWTQSEPSPERLTHVPSVGRPSSQPMMRGVVLDVGRAQ